MDFKFKFNFEFDSDFYIDFWLCNLILFFCIFVIFVILSPGPDEVSPLQAHYQSTDVVRAYTRAIDCSVKMSCMSSCHDTVYL